VVDQVIELHARWWQGPITRITRNDIDPASRDREIMIMQRTLHCLEHRLAHSQFIAADDFTLADCPALMLLAAPVFGIDLARWPKVVDYTKRLIERPTWREALSRARDLRAILAGSSSSRK
jgi:glutathione S-transferase